jgi:predicted small lipoprotein YifL
VSPAAKALVLLLALLTVAGCTAAGRLSQPRPARAWPIAWAAAQQAAETGRAVSLRDSPYRAP